MADDGLPHDSVPDARTLARFCDGRGFEARVIELNGATAVAVAGEIDMATAGLFRQALDRASGGDGPVIIDLAHATFMDSSGLEVVLGAYDRLGRRPDAVVLRNAGPPVRQVLEISGVDHFVTVVTDPGSDRRPHDASGSPVVT